jgi:hypothetical protein
MIQYNKLIVVRFRCAMVSQFCACEAYLQEMTSKSNPNDHETWSIWCHVRLHVDFYIHLEITYSIGPLSVVWSELGSAPPFPQMRDSKCNGHGHSVSCVKWPWVVLHPMRFVGNNLVWLGNTQSQLIWRSHELSYVSRRLWCSCQVHQCYGYFTTNKMTWKHNEDLHLFNQKAAQPF